MANAQLVSECEKFRKKQGDVVRLLVASDGDLKGGEQRMKTFQLRIDEQGDQRLIRIQSQG